jgi:hypothetical protein
MNADTLQDEFFFDNQRRACERIETLKEPLNEAFLA